ncbi:MAG: cell division protein FtsH [Candidatus Melainabacteria bacterium RIFOXYA12_FULL_32_12]|nr:MAG: cell division protein FtsH [Candidatus Melainabacteria bacterium RIFOXYA2_FULL_32_9]OGI30920.1 MAG: cell division protein FtsH [Candidatus Melainabacteria bacterium RIFOXYA12_FULL_32_12]
MKKYQTTGVYITLVLILLAFMVTVLTSKTDSVQDLSYSQFMKLVKESKIESVQITNNVITANPKTEPSHSALTETKYKVLMPNDNPSLIDKLENHNIDISVEPPNNSGQWVGLIGSLILPILLLVGLFLMFRSAQSGGSQAMSFGKSKAKMMLDSKVKVTFADVAGIDESKQELEEVVDFLKNGERYLALGAKIPKGVLLVGAPGTGKTLMAKAVAGEAGVPFFSISGSDFVEMFVGVGASRVRDLFEQAKKHAPCIVFIDEIDAVGRQRGAGLGGGHDEREQTLNQLLVEMDGFDGTTGIIIIAATNRPDILDNALLRPGRFDRQVVIDKPDIMGREQILEVHIKGKPLAEEVNLKVIAKRTPGFTGADLSNLINEAALLAARKSKKEIEMEDVEEAIDKVIAGPEKKNRIISEKEKEIIAYHEVGHALLAKLLKDCDPLHKVTIISRGMALGLTMTLPVNDQVLYSRTQLLDRMAMTLGGRISEEIIFNEITTGAQNDLEKVTDLARKMVTNFGMSEKMGPMTFGKRNEHVFLGRDFGHERNFSEEVASIIDREIKSIVEERYKFAKQILSENKDVMDEIVKVLLEKETLDEKEVDEIIERVKIERNNNQNYTEHNV